MGLQSRSNFSIRDQGLLGAHVHFVAICVRLRPWQLAVATTIKGNGESHIARDPRTVQWLHK